MCLKTVACPSQQYDGSDVTVDNNIVICGRLLAGKIRVYEE
jgi:hypothetical protein